MARATRKVLARTDLLFADCRRDILLASDWGLRVTAATAVLPGGGGINLAQVTGTEEALPWLPASVTERGQRLVVNATGLS